MTSASIGGTAAAGTPDTPWRARKRALNVFCAAAGAAAAGDGAAGVALTVRVRPAGAVWVAGLLAVGIAPGILLAPIAGLIIDRAGACRVIIAGYCGLAAVALTLTSVVSPAGTLAMAALHGCLLAATVPAALTFVPQVAGEERAARGYGRYGSSVAAGLVLGSIMAGGLASMAPGTVFEMEAAGSVAVALTCAAVRRFATRTSAMAAQTSDRHSDVNARRAAAEGIRLIWKEPLLRRAVLPLAVVTGAVTAVAVAAPYQVLAHSPALGTFGGYQGAFAAGGVGGSQLVLLTRARLTLRGRGLFFGCCLTGCGFVLVASSGAYSLLLAGAFIAGAGAGLTGAALDCLVRFVTPLHCRGRVFTAVAAATGIFSGITLFAIPSVIGLFGHSAVIFTAGTVTIAGGICVAIALGYTQRNGSLDTPANPQPAN